MALLTVLVGLVGGEVALRNLAGISWEGTDEYGGYILVAVTFLSMPVCLARGGMHEMQLLRSRLTPRGVAMATPKTKSSSGWGATALASGCTTTATRKRPS